MRPAQAVMVDLAASGLSAAQLALVMELSATVAAEARPVDDKSALRRRAKDRAYQAERRRQNRTISADSDDSVGSNERDNLTSHESKKSEPKGSSKKFVLPADIPAEPWEGWEDMRRRIHKTPTNRARSLAVAELRRLRDEEGWPPGDVLNHCTMNSYQGIFPPRKQRDERSDRDPTTVAVERFLRGDVGTHAGTG